MPTIALSSSIAANVRSANLLAGQSFEFLNRPARVSFYQTGSAAGLEADILMGGRSIAQAAVVPPTNRSPLRLEDGIVQTTGLSGDRLFITALNTTGGALVQNLIVDIEFLA